MKVTTQETRGGTNINECFQHVYALLVWRGRSGMCVLRSQINVQS